MDNQDNFEDFVEFMDRGHYESAIIFAKKYLPDEIEDIVDVACSHYIRSFEYDDAIEFAEAHSPNKINDIAQEAYVHSMKNSEYFNAMEIAEDYFPEILKETADEAYHKWMQMGMYGNALEIAEDHFKERTNYTAVLGMKNNIEQYENILMIVNPKKDDANKSGLLILPSIKQELENIAGNYLDDDNMINYISNEGYKTYKLNIESELSRINSNAKRKWENPKKYDLENKLEKALYDENYREAGFLKNGLDLYDLSSLSRN